MAAASYDLYIEQGATFRLSLLYGHKTGDLDADGNVVVLAYDLVGALLRLQIRQRAGSPVLISATTQNGGILIDPITGRIIITIHSVATELLTMKRAKYDLEVQYLSGDTVRVLQGKVTISAAITRGADLSNITSSVGTIYEVQEQDIPGPD